MVLKSTNLNPESHHKNIIVIGSGIGGLSAALELLENGYSVSVIEKDSGPGGNMKSIVYDDFVVDIGFRRYYCRIPEVLAFFKKVMCEDFIPYQHRIGVLYHNSIYDRDPVFSGQTRGMSAFTLARGLVNLLKMRLLHLFTKPINFEQRAYFLKGRLFTKVFSQGYYEKLKGRLWKDLPPDYNAEGIDKKSGFIPSFLKRVQHGVDDQHAWYHPKQGSHTLINSVYSKVQFLGGRFLFNARVKSIGKHVNGSWQVSLWHEGVEKMLETNFIVSSLPVEVSASLVFRESQHWSAMNKVNRNVLIVYFFLNSPPNFSHNCLRVTEPNTPIARITNYGSYFVDMVPQNKGCLGIEIFCSDLDVWMRQEDEELIQLTMEFCTRAGLFDPQTIVHHIVRRIVNTEVASSWEDYREDNHRMKLFDELSNVPGFYQINRTGIDKTIFAAIEAVKAIKNGHWESYMIRTAPNVKESWKSDLPSST